MNRGGETTPLLIINGFHPRLRYIPMGTFGLCDYLSQRGVGARIFSASLYTPADYLANMRSAIETLQPRCIGLIFHWKELLENGLLLSQEIRRKYPGITLVAGGFTAGFLGADLLRRCPPLDFIIQGDPEEPLLRLLKGSPVDEVPNLIYRSGGNSRWSHRRYAVDSATLNQLSYTKLSYLLDAQDYLRWLNQPWHLGFPLFIGRGCPYNCLYCGGSRRAFAAHSRRRVPVYRQVNAVMRDLRELRPYTDTVYVCYEPRRDHLRELFAAVASDRALAQQFRLNYGGWGLMGRELIDLYARAFKFEEARPSVVELSPETASDSGRRIIRDKRLYFSNRQMCRVIDALRQRLGSRVSVQVFYSRYHCTLRNRKQLVAEFRRIYRVQERYFIAGQAAVRVRHLHLATDPGSVYWDRAIRASGHRSGVDFLLQTAKRCLYPRATEPLFDELCAYAPPGLTQADREAYERLLLWTNMLARRIPRFYHTLMRAVGAGRVAALLMEMNDVEVAGGQAYKLNAVTLAWLIETLDRGLKSRYRSVYALAPAFFDGLFELYRRFVDASPVGRLRPDGWLAHRPVLDRTMICLTPYCYTDDAAYEALRKGIRWVRPQSTLYVFVAGTLCALPGRCLRSFELFDGRHTIKAIHDRVVADPRLSDADKRLLSRFFSKHSYHFTQ